MIFAPSNGRVNLLSTELQWAMIRKWITGLLVGLSWRGMASHSGGLDILIEEGRVESALHTECHILVILRSEDPRQNI
jgi:hypothetical protein